jgi:hypothetical protein
MRAGDDPKLFRALYARRVFSLRIFPNHSMAGSTSESRWNSAAVSARALSLTTRVLLLSSCHWFFARLLPMIIYFIMGKTRPEIHSFSRFRFSENKGDDLTLLGGCVLQKPAPLLDSTINTDFITE